ncbi:MAG TPA: PilZ domain-containing protein [Blastocatellia bacterium]|nr:PilZ domain-containing protein [Blastocatellia bacterium]
MSGFCDRCNERSSHLVNIAHLPELAAVEHLGYRQVCAPCYDDLLAEANEAADLDGRRQEARERVSIKARIEGNTSHLKPFSEDTTIEEISPSGVSLHTGRELDTGAVLKLVIPDQGFEAAAIVQTVFREGGRHAVGLLVEPSDAWDKIRRQYGNA